jgi:uncharacterized protein YejL (UPF0352 family)
MPIVSKYTNEQIESLVNELLTVMLKHKAPVDLSLLAIGNLTTHIIAERIPAAQQKTIAESFAAALVESIKNSDTRH